MPNITSAGVFWEEGREPPDYVDPRTAEELGVVIPLPADAEESAAEEAPAEPDADAEPGAEQPAGEVKAPPVRASRADWAAHAIEVHGADPGEVDEMTKQQIIGQFGSGAGE